MTRDPKEREIERIEDLLDNAVRRREIDLRWSQIVDIARILVPEQGVIEETPKPPEKDELFDEAVQLVQKYKCVSASFLISWLNITYTKATALIDQLEAHGIISPKDGAKPRKVL